jgi:hypothetical protein
VEGRGACHTALLGRGVKLVVRPGAAGHFSLLDPDRRCMLVPTLSTVQDANRTALKGHSPEI